MKLTLVLLVIAISFSLCVGFGQTSGNLQVDDGLSDASTSVIWERTYGGTADDRAFHAIPVEDGFLVVGSSRSIVADRTVGWVLRLDSEGNLVWNQTFLNGFGTEIRYAVNLTDGFLLVGNQFLSDDVNGFVARIDNQGVLLWEKTFGGEKIDKLFTGIVSKDGFAVFGLTYSNQIDKSEAWIIKISAEGNVVWDKTYGQSVDSALRAGALAHDGGYVAAGYMDALGFGNYDYYLLKVDSDGSLVWNITYGSGESEKAYAMTKAEGGYILAGEKQSAKKSTDAWLIKVNFNGNLLWDKTVSGMNADSPAYIATALDGDYLVAGFTFSFGEGERDFWLFKISDQGQVLFSCTQGDEAFQEAYGVIEVADNKYVMVGWTDPVGQPELVGKASYDFYIVCFNAIQNSDSLSLSLVAYAGALLGLLVAVFAVAFKLFKAGRIVNSEK